MRIVLIGPPGAGKSTQAQHLCTLFDVPYISTGSIFRNNISEGTELGLKVQEILDKGQLVSDDLTIKLMEDRLKDEDTKNGYILDGFPRTMVQAAALTDMLSEKGEALDVALHIDVSEDMIKSRVLGLRLCPSCGAVYHNEFRPPETEGICNLCHNNLILRKDNRPEALEVRLKMYNIATKSVVNYYKDQGILRTIPGDRSIEEISESITKSLEGFLHKPASVG